jgi:hypothetical protein
MLDVLEDLASQLDLDTSRGLGIASLSIRLHTVLRSLTLFS